MRTITVAGLRQNPTAALNDVAGGESLLVTEHRRPVAKLVPPDDDALVRIAPAKSSEASQLTGRPRAALHSYEETEALLADLESEG